MRFSEFFSDFHFILLPLRSNSKEADAEKDISSPKDYNDMMIKQRSRNAYLYNLWTELNFDEKKWVIILPPMKFFQHRKEGCTYRAGTKRDTVPIKNLFNVKGSWKDWELFSAVLGDIFLTTLAKTKSKGVRCTKK